MGSVSVGIESPLQAQVASLLAQSDAVAAALYPGEYRRPITVRSLAEPEAYVVVARIDGKAAGLCVVFDRGDGTTELKRMIVDAGLRGAGIGGALLRGAEAHSRRLGAKAMLLEVGTRNIEAQQLYRRSGYRACGPFPPYAATPISLFMSRELAETASP